MRAKRKYKKRNLLYDFIIITILFFVFYNKDFEHSLKLFILGLFVVILCSLLARIIGKRLYKKKILSSGLLELDQMEGIVFEQFLFYLFQKIGYSVQDTPKSHDFGADLILTMNDEKIVLQAKRSRNKIGINAVQEVLGAKYYYGADRAIVFTNSFYTSSAVELANAANIELFDRNKMIDKLNEINGKKIIEEYKQ